MTLPISIAKAVAPTAAVTVAPDLFLYGGQACVSPPPHCYG
jgi:hypothetical protein